MALIGFIVIFWLPAIFNWLPVLGDDYIYHHFPIKVLYAQSLKQGTLPWWDPHTFCGAWPIIHRPDGGPYYLPDYPFLLLTDLSNLDRAADLLVKLPLLLHYILMAGGAYLLGRIGLRLNRIGSVVLSVAYTMSPAVNYLVFAASIATLNAWLPLLWLFLILFVRRGGLRFVALGGLVFALQISGAGFGHLIRVWTFTGFLLVGLAFKALIERRWIRLRRVVAGGAATITLGVILSAPVWLGVFEGYRSLDSSGVVTFQTVAGGSNSLQPGYLATLLVPNLFGTVIGEHGWGVGLNVLFDQTNLLGGMLLAFLVGAGVIAAFRAPGAPERFWIYLSGVGVVLGLFLVIGRHSPVYRLLFQSLPPFRVPYAIRWRDFQCYSMSILAGSAASLLTGNRSQIRIINRLTVTIVGVMAAAIVAAAALLPFYWNGTWFQPGITYASASGELNQILNDLAPYLLFCLVVLAAIWALRRRRVSLLVVGVLVEMTIFGWQAFYLHRDWFGDDPLITRYPRFSQTPLAKVAGMDLLDSPPEAGLYRTAFYRSRLANSAWLTGGLSLFGYDCKPLLPRFNQAFRRIGPGGIVYELVLDKWESRFLPNMSVRWAVVEAEQVDPEATQPTVEDIINPVVETDGAGARLADRPMVVVVPDALPRLFTQDTVICCSEEEALEELMEGDLRRGVFVEESDRLSAIGDRSILLATDYRVPITDYGSFNPGSEQEIIEHFNGLQSANRILNLDLSNPNRVRLTIGITIPSMLVMTDLWHPDWSATVNREPARLLRVNYLQRGLWLQKGQHEVIMTFVPDSWRIGRWGTIAGLLIVLLLLVFGKWQSQLNQKIPRAGPQPS